MPDRLGLQLRESIQKGINSGWKHYDQAGNLITDVERIVEVLSCGGELMSIAPPDWIDYGVLPNVPMMVGRVLWVPHRIRC